MIYHDCVGTRTEPLLRPIQRNLNGAQLVIVRVQQILTTQ
jgi:hypothetical protein